MNYCNDKGMACELANIGGGCSVSACRKVIFTPGGNRPFEPLYVKPPMTNADRIRAMSDDELAKFIMGEPVNYCHTGLCLDGETCVGCYLKWLQQPAEEDDHT